MRQWEKINIFSRVVGGVGGVLFACMTLSIRYSMELFVISVVVFLIFMIMSVYVYRKITKYEKIYKTEDWNEIVSRVLSDMLDYAAYSHDGGFSSQHIVDMDLLGTPFFVKFDNLHNFNACNYIHVKYKEIDLKHSDVEILTRRNRHPSRLFYGRILEIEYPLSTSSKLKIYTNNFPDIRGELFQSISGKIRKTHKESFDNEFQVRCDSEETFQDIITPEMMGKLVHFHSIYHVFAMEFFNNKLYIALETKRETFTLDYSEKPDYDCLVAQIKMDVQFIKDVVDIFCRDLQ